MEGERLGLHEEQKGTMRSLKFLARYLIDSKKNIILGIIFTLFMSITEIFPGVVYKVIADSLSNLTLNADRLSIKVPVKFMDMKFDQYKFSINEPGKIFQTFVLICVLFLVIYILDGLFRYLRDIYFNFAIQKVLKEIRDVICGKILRLPYAEFKKNRTGDLMSRVTYDTTILQNVIDVFIELSRSSISLIIFCPVLFYIDWKISLFAALFFPVSLYIIKYYSKRMKRLSRGISDAAADYTEFLKDRAERNSAVKLAGFEENEHGDFKDITQRNYELSVRNIKIKYFLKPSNEIIGIFGIAVIAAYFCWLLVNKQMGAGNIVLYLSVLKSAYKPFKKVAESVGDLHFSLAGADKIVALLDKPEEDMGGTKDPGTIDSIGFKNAGLSFGDKEILNDLNMNFEKGRSYGITGPSGAGKTSLVNMIPLLYRPTSGDLVINGGNASEFDLKSLRRKISLAGSDNYELNGKINEIISYGIKDSPKVQLSDEQIKDFLDIKDYSLEMIIGKDGAVLSAGQIQKVILINSILKDPEIFIIDESLDLLSREDIDKFFSFVRKNIILIIISRQEHILNRLDEVIKL